MKLRKLFIPFFALAALLSSCAPDQLDTLSEVKAEPSYIGFAVEGGEKEVTLTTQGSWTITGIPEWIEVSKTSGEAAPAGEVIKIKVLKAYEDLSAELRVNVGPVSQVITVKQSLGDKVEITTDKELIENGIKGKTYTIQGAVGKIEGTEYGNFYMSDGTYEGTDGKSAYVYGLLDPNGQEKGTPLTAWGISEGDVIQVTGPLDIYGSKYELVKATLVKIVSKALLGADQTEFLVTNEAGTLAPEFTLKGDEIKVAVDAEADWIHWEGIEGSGEDRKVLISYDEYKDGKEPRTGTLVLSTSKEIDEKLEESQLTITIQQMPATPAVETIASIKFADKGFHHINGEIVALTTKGFVIADETGKAYVNMDDFNWREYKIGYKMSAVGYVKTDYAKLLMNADVLSVLETNEKELPEDAIAITKDNASGIYSQSPADHKYYKVSGFVSADNKLYLTDDKSISVSLIDAINNLALKGFAEKYVDIEGYCIDTNSGSKEIKLAGTKVEENDNKVTFLKITYSKNANKPAWDATSAKFDISTTEDQEWSVALAEEAEGVTLSKTSGKGPEEIEVEFPANRTYSSIKYTVNVTPKDGEVQSFYITHSGKELAFLNDNGDPTTKDISIKSEETVAVLPFSASRYWSATVDNDKAKLEVADGKGSGALVLSFPANTSETDDVVYTVTLAEERPYNNEETESVTIKVVHKKYSPIIELKNIKEFLDAQEDKFQNYEISGIVNNISDAAKGRFTINDATGSVYVYGLDKSLTSLNVAVGDIITITGIRSSYKGTPQVGGGTYVKHESIETKTVAEFLAAPESTEEDPVYYRLTGQVIKSEEAGTKFDLVDYGNFAIKDATGNVYVYGVKTGYHGESKKFSTLGVKEGNEITIYGYRTSYKGLNQVGGACYISHKPATAE